jgi:7-keto-8-aminopelargonate synthetase-like enzyme
LSPDPNGPSSTLFSERGRSSSQRHRHLHWQPQSTPLARYLRQRLGLPEGDSPIIPYVLGENERAVKVAERLQAEGFDVRAIRPPTVPMGTARLRISINFNLSETTLDHFAKALENACKVCS